MTKKVEKVKNPRVRVASQILPPETKKTIRDSATVPNSGCGDCGKK